MTNLLANVRHVHAVQRAQQQVFARVRGPRRAPFRSRCRDALAALALRAALPALLLVAAWNATLSPETKMRFWSFVAIGVLLASGHVLQSRLLSFSAREVLFLPDKSSVLAARLQVALPGLLARGIVWAIACFLQLRPLFDARPIAVAILCTTAFLAPLAWNVGEVLRRLLAPESGSSLIPMALIGMFVVHAADRTTWPGTDPLRWGGFAAMAAIGGVGALAVARLWWLDARGTARALWTDIVHLPRLVVVLVLLVRARDLDGAPLTWLVTSGAIALLVFLPLATWHALYAVAFAEAETDGSMITRAGAGTPPPARTREPEPRPQRGGARNRDRSPWRAAWRLFRIEHGPDWHGLLRPRQCLRSMLSIAGFSGQLLVRYAPLLLPLFQFHPRATLFVAFCVFLPSWLGDDHKQRRHAFGVDWHDQARVHMTAVLLFATLPALSLAIVLAAKGWADADAWLPIGVAAVYSLRLGWRGFAAQGEAASLTTITLLAVALLATSFCLPLTAWTVLPLLALGLFGCVRRVQRWREPELTMAFNAARETESRGAAAG